MTANKPEKTERTFVEAGFYGFAVIYGVAGLVLIVVPFAASFFTGSFALVDYELGIAGLAFAGGFWLLSWLARSEILGKPME